MAFLVDGVEVTPRVVAHRWDPDLTETVYALTDALRLTERRGIRGMSVRRLGLRGVRAGEGPRRGDDRAAGVAEAGSPLGRTWTSGRSRPGWLATRRAAVVGGFPIAFGLVTCLCVALGERAPRRSAEWGELLDSLLSPAGGAAGEGCGDRHVADAELGGTWSCGRTG